MDENTLAVKIRTREEVVFEGEATSISSFNKTGKFDVLPLHSNFIAMLEKEVLVVKKGGGEERFPLNQEGVIKVTRNRVEIFLGVRAS